MNKKKYLAPCVLKTVEVLSEEDILAGSVVTKDSEIKTTGQEVVEYDFSDSSFNQVWE